MAVELRVNDADAPIWGNLSNTSLGGCQVETATHISGGAKVEIGLWVASGKIWVKGLALNGVVTRSAPAGGVRVRFEGMDPAGKENLRQFLKYVQETTRASNSESSYLQTAEIRINLVFLPSFVSLLLVFLSFPELHFLDFSQIRRHGSARKLVHSLRS